MPPLYIHDAPPYSSIHICRNVSRCRSILFAPFELLDKRSDMRGDGGRESVVLGLEAVPN
jgi:hypothetical protein